MSNTKTEIIKNLIDDDFHFAQIYSTKNLKMANAVYAHGYHYQMYDKNIQVIHIIT